MKYNDLVVYITTWIDLLFYCAEQTKPDPILYTVWFHFKKSQRLQWSRGGHWGGGQLTLTRPVRMRQDLNPGLCTLLLLAGLDAMMSVSRTTILAMHQDPSLSDVSWMRNKGHFVNGVLNVWKIQEESHEEAKLIDVVARLTGMEYERAS